MFLVCIFSMTCANSIQYSNNDSDPNRDVPIPSPQLFIYHHLALYWLCFSKCHPYDSQKHNGSAHEHLGGELFFEEDIA